MITEKQKTLLKQAIDLTMNTISGQIMKSAEESERSALRDVMADYLALSHDVNAMDVEPIELPKTKKDVSTK